MCLILCKHSFSCCLCDQELTGSTEIWPSARCKVTLALHGSCGHASVAFISWCVSAHTNTHLHLRTHAQKHNFKQHLLFRDICFCQSTTELLVTAHACVCICQRAWETKRVQTQSVRTCLATCLQVNSWCRCYPPVAMLCKKTNQKKWGNW